MFVVARVDPDCVASMDPDCVASMDPDCVASMDPDCVASITGLVQGCEAGSSKQLRVSKVFDSGSRMI